ncbi:MAG: signal peptidase II [Oscillospiraceae bacterium]
MAGAITIAVTVVLVAIDQIIKFFVSSGLKPIGIIELIPGFIRFRYVENTGAAFGILQEKTGILIAMTIIVMAIGFYILIFQKLNGKVQYAGAVLILSGGLGNLIDRIVRHYVVDYIEFTFVDFAVFNFADSLITVGAILLIISLIKELIDESKSKKLQEEKDV